VLEFILKYLGLAGKINRRGEYIVPSGYKLPVSPEEKKLLAEMEVLLQKGKFRSASREELQNLLGVSPDKLKKLMSLLIERKKIVQGKDGFLVDSEWLDVIIARVMNLDKKELRVADFKKMTGLSRKYAIPLLELLDQMKITRRRGSTREIL
jgi:selenocysteine-specific elongation factor